MQKYQRECAELKEQLQTITMEFETAKAQLSARDETIDSLKQDKGAFYQGKEWLQMFYTQLKNDSQLKNDFFASLREFLKVWLEYFRIWQHV